ncbi:MAG: DUF3096 domain-containing protein [Chloroflexota bacterium]
MLGGVISIHGILAGAITITVGIVILIWPKLLTTLLGLYLIVVGIIAVLGSL